MPSSARTHCLLLLSFFLSKKKSPPQDRESGRSDSAVSKVNRKFFCACSRRGKLLKHIFACRVVWERDNESALICEGQTNASKTVFLSISRDVGIWIVSVHARNYHFEQKEATNEILTGFTFESSWLLTMRCNYCIVMWFSGKKKQQSLNFCQFKQSKEKNAFFRPLLL